MAAKLPTVTTDRENGMPAPVSRAGLRALLLLPVIVAAACRDASGPRLGALAVRVSGLPEGAAASITVTGPGGVARTVASSDTLTDLAPGDYTIASAGVAVRGSLYEPVPPTLTARVVPGDTPAQAAVSYAIITGSLVVEASGLGDGVRPTYMVSGNGASHTVTGSDTLAGLAPGRYTVAATPVSTPADSWAPTTIAQEVEVAVSPVPARATVAFSLTTGRIALSVVDLPPSLGAAVTVSDERGFSLKLDGGRTITGLAPGRYTVACGGMRRVVRRRSCATRPPAGCWGSREEARRGFPGAALWSSPCPTGCGVASSGWNKAR